MRLYPTQIPGTPDGDMGDLISLVLTEEVLGGGEVPDPAMVEAMVRALRARPARRILRRWLEKEEGRDISFRRGS